MSIYVGKKTLAFFALLPFSLAPALLWPIWLVFSLGLTIYCKKYGYNRHMIIRPLTDLATPAIYVVTNALFMPIFLLVGIVYLAT